MKQNVRGTSKDPRASSQEKWLMKVEMIQDRRRFTILADRAHFLKYKVGDRVRVRYKQGNYTGTVWDSQIED
jgi:primosomal protein N'